MRTVIIKGNIFRSMLAANQRCITLYEPHYDRRFDQTIAQCDEECTPELQQWLLEDVDMHADQTPAGTLLFYSGPRQFGKHVGFDEINAAWEASLKDVTGSVTQRDAQ